MSAEAAFGTPMSFDQRRGRVKNVKNFGGVCVVSAEWSSGLQL